MNITLKYGETEPPLSYVGKGDKYHIQRLLDEGSFGQVFQASETTNFSKKYAVKFELPQTKQSKILHECKVYRHIHDFNNQPQERCYIPRIYYCAKEDDYNLLVMELMGFSLRELLIAKQIRDNSKPTMKFPMRTVILLAEQMISALQFIHLRGIVHRDIKPANFCVGLRQNKNRIYLVDFGLSKKYMVGMNHIPMTKTKGIIGNRTYASLANHRLSEQSRRDDLESLAYILIDFAKGTLPWKNIVATNPNRRSRMVTQMKRNIILDKLCEGLHISFLRFIQAVRSLQFREEPNYQYYKNMFRMAFLDLEFERKQGQLFD